jgi:hypothetical protein
MKYIVLGYFPEKFEAMSESERNAMFDDCFTYDDELRPQKKNGPDSRSTEPGLFFCYWRPKIVENRRVRCELPRTPFERSPPHGI